jgi:L-iditol 2-dehydrogenase
VLGVSCGEYLCNGAFAEYIAVPACVLYHLPDAVTFEQAAMIEPLSVALHAVNVSGLTMNKTAVVVGAGMIGLLIVQVLKLAGCYKVAAVDVVQEKLDLAKSMGADLTINSSVSDPGEVLRAVTDGRGVDYAFEAVGISPSVQQAAALLRKGGTLVLVGNLKPTIEFPLQSVVTRQITVFGSCASAGEYPDCLKLIASGKVDVGALVSASAPLSQGAEWFKRLYAREPGLMKVILKP